MAKAVEKWNPKAAIKPSKKACCSLRRLWDAVLLIKIKIISEINAMGKGFQALVEKVAQELDAAKIIAASFPKYLYAKKT